MLLWSVNHFFIFAKVNERLRPACCITAWTCFCLYILLLFNVTSHWVCINLLYDFPFDFLFPSYLWVSQIKYRCLLESLILPFWSEQTCFLYLNDQWHFPHLDTHLSWAIWHMTQYKFTHHFDRGPITYYINLCCGYLMPLWWFCCLLEVIQSQPMVIISPVLYNQNWHQVKCTVSHSSGDLPLSTGSPLFHTANQLKLHYCLSTRIKINASLQVTVVFFS